MTNVEGNEVWIGVAVGVAALALVSLLVWLVARRRRSGRDAATAAALHDVLDELARVLDETRRDAERARTSDERVASETLRLRPLSELGIEHDLRSLLDRAAETAAKIANVAAAMVVLDREGGEPTVATFGLSSEEAARNLAGPPLRPAEARSVLLTYRYSADEIDYDELRLRGGVALPLFGPAGERIGTLSVFWRRREGAMANEDLELLERAADSIGPAIAAAVRVEEAQATSDTDPVTGLHNRRYFEEALEREWGRARRYGRGAALLRFAVEDDSGTRGEPVSHDALVTVADRLRGCTRSVDVACHLDEGEFAVLLPETNEEAANQILNRIRETVRTAAAAAGARVRIIAATASVRPDEEPRSLLSHVDDVVVRARGGLDDERMPAPA